MLLPYPCSQVYSCNGTSPSKLNYAWGITMVYVHIFEISKVDSIASSVSMEQCFNASISRPYCISTDFLEGISLIIILGGIVPELVVPKIAAIG